MGKRDQRAIARYLLRLCEHLLKLMSWETERERCSRAWILEIDNFQAEIALILRDSPSLKVFVREAFLETYPKARKNFRQAILLSTVPQVLPFTLAQALAEDGLP